MAIKVIDKAKCKDSGETSEIQCPSCKTAVKLKLIKCVDKSAMSTILGRDLDTDFAVCPHCASVFSINENYIKAIENGMTAFLTSDDLSPLKRTL